MQYYIKKHLFWVLLMFRVLAVHGQKAPQTADQIKLSLSDVWQKADAYSKSIAIKRLTVDGSGEEVKDAQMERLPELSVGGNYEKATNIPVYTNGLFNTPIQHEVIHTLYKIGGEGYLNIYNGNKTNLKISEEKTLQQIAVERKNLTVSEIRLRAAAYYLELQKSNIFKALMTKDIADQEKQLAQIKNFLKQGVVLKSDVLRAELKLSHQKMALVQIDNDIAIANQKLNILIGQPDEQVIIPVEEIDPDSLPLKSYTEYLAEAMDKSFEYRISKKETELRQIQLKAVNANVLPKVGLYGDFNFANPEIFLYPYYPNLYSLGIAGIKVSYPISAFYLNKHKEKAAQIEFRKQEIEHSDTEDKVRQQVNEAYLRFKEALIRVGVAKVNVVQATENLRIVNNTYFNQTSLITDLLDADVQLLQTRLDYAASRLAAQLQYYQLQNVLGNL